MSFTPGIVTTAHEEVSRKEGWDTAGRFAPSRVLQCAWADRWTLAGELYGQFIAEANPPGGASGLGQNNQISPALYPGRNDVYVQSVPDCVGYPDSNNDYDKSGGSVADWQYARLTVQYHQPYFSTQTNGQPRVTENIEPTVEFLTVANNNLWWDNGTTFVKINELEAPALQVRGIEFVYEIQGAPKIPLATITLLGTVNAAQITSSQLGLTFLPETLLYNPPTLKRFFFVGNNVSAWDLTYRFSYRPTGWNKFFRSGKVLPEYMYNAASGGIAWKPYPLGDFTTLIS